ncbi:antibiotic biosynthesis monooxygenase [Streptomyces viridiviolaceus]
MPQAREAVTVVYTWEVVPGREPEFEHWAHGIEAEAAAFTGHRVVTWLRPEGDSHRYHAVVRFSDTRSLEHWTTSPQRAAWQARVRPFGHSAHPRLTTTGLETWFDVPNGAARGHRRAGRCPW